MGRGRGLGGPGRGPGAHPAPGVGAAVGTPGVSTFVPHTCLFDSGVLGPRNTAPRPACPGPAPAPGPRGRWVGQGKQSRAGVLEEMAGLPTPRPAGKRGHPRATASPPSPSLPLRLPHCPRLSLLPRLRPWGILPSKDRAGLGAPIVLGAPPALREMSNHREPWPSSQVPDAQAGQGHREWRGRGAKQACPASSQGEGQGRGRGGWAESRRSLGCGAQARLLPRGNLREQAWVFNSFY